MISNILTTVIGIFMVAVIFTMIVIVVLGIFWWSVVKPSTSHRMLGKVKDTGEIVEVFPSLHPSFDYVTTDGSVLFTKDELEIVRKLKEE